MAFAVITATFRVIIEGTDLSECFIGRDLSNRLVADMVNILLFFKVGSVLSINWAGDFYLYM